LQFLAEEPSTLNRLTYARIQKKPAPYHTGNWGPFGGKGKGKIKLTLVEVLRLCTGRTALRGSTGIALPFLDHGTRRG
jgi:hypothetical protein